MKDLIKYSHCNHIYMITIDYLATACIRQAYENSEKWLLEIVYYHDLDKVFSFVGDEAGIKKLFKIIDEKLSAAVKE